MDRKRAHVTRRERLLERLGVGHSLEPASAGREHRRGRGRRSLLDRLGITVAAAPQEVGGQRRSPRGQRRPSTILERLREG